MDVWTHLTYWFWFGFSAFLIICELLLGTSFFLLWLGIVATVVGIVTALIPALIWQYQILIFSFGAVFSIIFWYHYLKLHTKETDNPTLNRRAEQYIGRVFSLSVPIVNGRGKINVDDSSWQVEGPDLPLGTKVKVIDVDGVILKVKENN